MSASSIASNNKFRRHRGLRYQNPRMVSAPIPIPIPIPISKQEPDDRIEPEIQIGGRVSGSSAPRTPEDQRSYQFTELPIERKIILPENGPTGPIGTYDPIGVQSGGSAQTGPTGATQLVTINEFGQSVTGATGATGPTGTSDVGWFWWILGY